MNRKRAMNERQRKKREEILSVAVELFCEQGYEGLSVDQVVERVGGSKSTIYSYFRSKEDLYLEAVDSLKDRAINLTTIAKNPLVKMDPTPGKIRENLIDFGVHLLSVFTTPEFIKLNDLIIASKRSFPHLSEAYYEAGPQDAENIITEYLTLADKSDIIRCKMPRWSAHMFMGAVRANFVWKRVYYSPLEAMNYDDIRNYVVCCVDGFLMAHGYRAADAVTPLSGSNSRC